MEIQINCKVPFRGLTILFSITWEIAFKMKSQGGSPGA
jgi:hypothetical protein